MTHKAVFFNFGRWGEEGKAYLTGSAALKNAGVEVAFAEGILDKDRIPADVDFDILGIFTDSLANAEVIGAFPSLKLIAALSTGFDHIDIEEAHKRGIVVSSVPAYGANTVAEYAFALILALSRKICEARARVRDERLFTTDGLRGFDLAGKTLGVIGTGHIGRHAIRIGGGFGMNVVAYDVHRDDDFAKEAGFTYAELPKLLAESDIVSIHCPYLPSTHHLINVQNINLIKRGAYLINTSRGAIIETPALRGALASGQLGGAGLDVLEDEDEMKRGNMDVDRDLVTMPNVIVTPHTAFNTKEAFLRILDTTIENIVNFTKGTPSNIVKP